MDVAKEYLIDSSVEFSPGHVMTGLLKTKIPDMKTISMADMVLEDAEFLLNKWKNQEKR